MKYIFTILQIFIYFSILQAQSLVGHFPLDGTATDISPYALHGTIQNGVTSTIDRLGNIDGCYEFDGIDDHILSSVDNRNITNQVTLSAWVKTTSNKYQWVVGKYRALQDKGYQLFVRAGYAHIGGRDGNNTYIITDSIGAKVNDGLWHHIVGIVDNDKWEVWVDCKLITSFSTGHQSVDLASTEPLTIGNYNNQGSSYVYFDGQIDDVQIYDYALLPSEINTLCNNGVVNTQVVEQEDGITIAPNPTFNQTHITLKEGFQYKLQVYDATGKVILNITNSSSFLEVNLDQFSDGLYFFRFYNKERIVTKKVLKIN